MTLLLLLKLKERAGNSVPDEEEVGKQEERVLGLYIQGCTIRAGRVQSGDLSRSRLAIRSQGRVFAPEKEQTLSLLSDLS